MNADGSPGIRQRKPAGGSGAGLELKPETVAFIKNLDVFPKVNEDFFTRTLSGGIITIVSSLFMFILFVGELRMFLTVETANELFVDTSRGETLAINLDVTFPHVACSVMSLDAMDISGDQHLDVVHNVIKRRLSPEGLPIDAGVKHLVGKDAEPHVPVVLKHKDGRPVLANETYCGSCYGAEDAESDCCNTCDEVREAYRRRGWAFAGVGEMEQCAREGFLTGIREQANEGCNIAGHLEVNKVAGNFHFAPGKSFQQAHMHVHDLLPFEGVEFNMSHRVNRLSFGAEFPGVVNPLDGVWAPQNISAGMFQYFIKVVPTAYHYIRGKKVQTNQFSVTEHFRAIVPGTGNSLPGVFFFYDLSPIKVRFRESRLSFLQFVTSVCAIVGGVFTVSGIVDALVFHGHKLVKKTQQGKHI